MFIELRKRLNRFWFNCLKNEIGVCSDIFKIGIVKEVLVVEKDVLGVDI